MLGVLYVRYAYNYTDNVTNILHPYAFSDFGYNGGM